MRALDTGGNRQNVAQRLHIDRLSWCMILYVPGIRDINGQVRASSWAELQPKAVNAWCGSKRADLRHVVRRSNPFSQFVCPP